MALCGVCHAKEATVKQDKELCGTCAVEKLLYGNIDNLPPALPLDRQQFDFDRYHGVVGPSQEVLVDGIVDAVYDHVAAQSTGPCSVATLSDPVVERMVQCLAS